MKPTFAVVLLAALAPCLLAIDRIAAAPPEGEAAKATSTQKSVDAEKGPAATAKAACDGCCEKSCCEDKPSAGEKECCSDKACCNEENCSSEKTCSGEKTCCSNDKCCSDDNCCSEKSCCSENADGKNRTADKQAAKPKPKSLVWNGSGLKLFWTLSPEQPAAVTTPKPCESSACAGSVCTSSACAKGTCSDSSAAAKAPESGVTEYRVGSWDAASRVHYAAIPGPVPSPFAKDGGNLLPPVLPTQAVEPGLPVQIPPAPLALSAAPAVAPNPLPYQIAAAPAVAPREPHCPNCTAPANQEGVTQVLFDIHVVVDESESLNEFESLQGDMPFLTADSEVVLATLRILEKQNLVRPIWTPRLVTTTGRPATFQIGTEVPRNNEGESAFEGFLAKVGARELGGGLALEFEFCNSSGGQRCEVATSLLIAHGQTVIMKAGRRKANDSEQCDEEKPMYVVVTPQIVK
jgi:hypothetical protein